MQQEAADELRRGQRHGLPAVLLAVVFPAEADRAVVERQDTLVGDGHAVGVAAEIVEHAGGAVEGGPGVDHPLAAAKGPQPAREGVRVGQGLERTAEAQAAV